MELPDNLHYTKDHEWIASLEGTSSVGVSSYAIEQLGDIVHIELPEVGSSFSAGDSFGTIESTKTVSDLYMPVDGKIIAINEDIVSTPESLQEDPYDKGWLVKVEISGKPEEGVILSAASYKDFIASE